MTKPNAADIDALLEGKQVVPSLRSQLPALVERFGKDRIIVVPSLVAVMRSERSEWGGSGGIGYFSQVTVVCGQATEMKEWQYRDRYQASRDRWDLAVHDIGAVKVERNGTTVTVDVELKHNRSGSRHAIWTFTDIKESEVAPSLDEVSQIGFRQTFEAVVKKERVRLNEMYALKNRMVGRRGDYVPYQEPRIKQQLVRADLGMGVFVSEEQIDHRVDDPQVRYRAILVDVDGSTTELAEDHAYERREGSAVIAIIDLAQNGVTLNIRGKQTIVVLP